MSFAVVGCSLQASGMRTLAAAPRNVQSARIAHGPGILQGNGLGGASSPEAARASPASRSLLRIPWTVSGRGITIGGTPPPQE